MNTILLAKKGRMSRSKHTGHINVRYFFIEDAITNKEVEIVYCTTGNMASDMFTKPLHSCLFKNSGMKS